jgi:hypothetical protein
MRPIQIPRSVSANSRAIFQQPAQQAQIYGNKPPASYQYPTQQAPITTAQALKAHQEYEQGRKAALDKIRQAQREYEASYGPLPAEFHYPGTTIYGFRNTLGMEQEDLRKAQGHGFYYCGPSTTSTTSAGYSVTFYRDNGIPFANPYPNALDSHVTNRANVDPAFHGIVPPPVRLQPITNPRETAAWTQLDKIEANRLSLERLFKFNALALMQEVDKLRKEKPHPGRIGAVVRAAGKGE